MPNRFALLLVLVVVGLLVVALVLGTPGRVGALDRRSRRRIASRVAEIPASANAHREIIPAGGDGALAPVHIGPRLRLWRDTSAILAVFGLALMAFLTLDVPVPAGSVLQATRGHPGRRRPRRSQHRRRRPSPRSLRARRP